jgi:hypothetical protein
MIHRPLPLPLAGQTIRPMDQEVISYQRLLCCYGERGQIASLENRGRHEVRDNSESFRRQLGKEDQIGGGNGESADESSPAVCRPENDTASCRRRWSVER